MYKVIVNGETVGTFDGLVYIIAWSNGSYIPCEKDKADGICVKLPREVSREVEGEDGVQTTETMTVYEDTVYALREGGLTGVEPVCSVVEE